MIRRTPAALAATLSMLLLIFAPMPGRASGGGDEGPPEFNSPWGPVRPLPDLISGSLGVVEASWWRKPLLLAWFRLNELALPAGAEEAFRYTERLSGDERSDSAVADWLAAARAANPALSPSAEFLASAHFPMGNAWDSFENCPASAWLQAKETLAARLQVWGKDSAALRNWLVAQHQVFARCALGPSHFRRDLDHLRPVEAERVARHLLADMNLADPPPDAPILLRQDRAYQRAAALFYEGFYDQAEKSFQAIAADKASAWRAWGAYLALRARFRSIQVLPPKEIPGEGCGSPECASQRAAYRKKEGGRLLSAIDRAIVSAGKGGGGDEAQRLQDLRSLVAARFVPELRLRELAAELVRPGIDAESFQRVATDYLHLHRQTASSEELGEWMSALVDGSPAVDSACGNEDSRTEELRYKRQLCLQRSWSQESLKRFLQQPTRYAWLFSAAVFAERGDPQSPALLKALSAVPDKHPGATTFMLQRLRLGSREEALVLAKALLKRPDVMADYSARNRVREYRLQHAANLHEFWADALREGGQGFDRDTLLPSAAPDPSLTAHKGLDADAQWILNYELPHSALIETAKHSGWPAPYPDQVANMALTRAQLRKDAAGVREALAVLAELDKKSPDKDVARLRAITDNQVLLLEVGVLERNAKISGSCRLSVPKPGSSASDGEEAAGGYKYQAGKFSRQLLKPAEHEAWLGERKGYEAEPDLISASMQNVLDFAARFPADARVPDLLRKAVYATRMNWCADVSAGGLSKKAYDLLKLKYPESKAARTTKYWFKPRS